MGHCKSFSSPLSFISVTSEVSFDAARMTPRAHLKYALFCLLNFLICLMGFKADKFPVFCVFAGISNYNLVSLFQLTHNLVYLLISCIK